jgi:peroxiredoxin Q/BCP
VLLGVSRDTVEAQRTFKEKYNLPFTLLADPEMKVVKAYGVLKDKNMYGKMVKGIQRATFVIGPDGVVRKAFPAVKPEGHAEEVLAALAGR